MVGWAAQASGQVQGTATYWERMALSPDAVFEAILEGARPTWAFSCVITACAPGKREAALVSMCRIRGWGLHSRRATTIARRARHAGHGLRLVSAVGMLYNTGHMPWTHTHEERDNDLRLCWCGGLGGQGSRKM
jgi:hypothetical protein